MAVVSTNLGRVGLLPKGEYNAETPYVRLDIVTHEGTAYVAIQDSTGVTPGENPETWQLLAERGGIGPTGPEGPEGKEGTPGTPGAKGDKGNGITSVQENEDTSLTFNFDDLDPFKTSPLKGEKGDQGEPNIVKGAAYDSLESLQAAVQDAKEGDQYNVGVEPPYNVYRWTGSKWEDQGKTQGPAGPAGPSGEPGTPGKDGVTFIPSVAEDGTLSWTNDGERENPKDVNIKGEPGENGLPGEQGEQGEPGKAPQVGENGNWETWDNESSNWTDTGVRSGTKNLDATIPIEQWSGEDVKTATVSVQDLKATDNPIIDIALTGSKEEMVGLLNAWGLLLTFETGEGELTVTAADTPEVEIPLKIKLLG